MNVRPMTKAISRCASKHKNDNIESKMDAMIKLYESIAAEQSVRGAKKKLDARNIIYYDAQKTVGAPNFDKRSSKGKTLILAKQIVKREKLLAQRGYRINAKRREVSIGMARLELQDN
ncbi:hypothetical protein GGI17_000115 [Coemansia sp. S146]|nr:hypothetical protein GGI17_000115 [Coemansia sp. S146]